GRVGVPEIGADVLLRAMVHCAMPGELPPYRPVNGAFVGHQVSGAIDIGGNDWSQGLGSDIRDVEATDTPIALDQGQDRGLRRNAALPVRGLAAYEGFVAFDDLIGTPERVRAIHAEFGHRLANAVPEEPCGLHAAAKSALK